MRTLTLPLPCTEGEYRVLIEIRRQLALTSDPDAARSAIRRFAEFLEIPMSADDFMVGLQPGLFDVATPLAQGDGDPGQDS